jgi:hypothetical protein
MRHPPKRPFWTHFGHGLCQRCPEEPFFRLLHEGQKVLVHKVSVPHRRSKIRMPHRLLDQNRALALGEPCGDPAVPEVVLVQVGWEVFLTL